MRNSPQKENKRSEELTIECVLVRADQSRENQSKPAGIGRSCRQPINQYGNDRTKEVQTVLGKSSYIV